MISITVNERNMNPSLLDFINKSPTPESPPASILENFIQSKAKLNESIRCDGSVSELSHSVNDSARGLNFDEVYKKREILGEGGFATVYRCIHKGRGLSYAVKEVHNENYETSGESINEEIDALKRLRDGPYIVRLLDVFSEPDVTHLVMEQMKGGDLLFRLGEKEVFTESESRKISRRLIEAVSFCHKKRIAHRDIKLENILLTDRMDDTKIKLADFGCAHPFVPGERCLKSLCGSPQYASPELFLNEDGYDERCDVWSTGVVIFILLGGYAPFEGSGLELPRIICEGYFEFPPIYWGTISEDAKSLIRSLLVVNPDNRATLVDALESEWLRRRDKESVLKHSSVNLDGSYTSVFDAWVRLQRDMSESKLKSESNNTEVSTTEVSTDHMDSFRSLFFEDRLFNS